MVAMPRRAWILAFALLGGCAAAFRAIKDSEALRYVLRWANGVLRKEGTRVDGLQQGDWAFYYESGKVRAKGRYEKDIQDGPWTYYYENGNVEWQGGFAAGKRSGPFTFYFPDGRKRAEGWFREEHEEGEWRFYSQSGGTLEQQGDYQDGRVAGLWRYWHPDGKPRAAGAHWNAVRVGTWQQWAADGAVSETRYPLPEGVALVLERWPDDKPRRLCTTVAGQPAGRWTTWHPNGQERLSCDLAQGRAEGPFFLHKADGSLLATGVLKAGALAGEWRVSGATGVEVRSATPLPPMPPAAAEWSDAAFADQQPAETVLATWLAELTAPVAAPPPPATTQPAPPVVASEPATNPRVAPSAQPEFTVQILEQIDALVNRYLKKQAPPPRINRRYETNPRATESNTSRRADLEGKPLGVSRFRAPDGTVTDLNRFRGKQNVMVIVLRGFFGQVCEYCAAQTKALTLAKERLDQLGVEVLVIYPGPASDQQAFLDAYRCTFGDETPPYKIHYDPDLQVVKQIGIEGGQLAWPTTLVVDKEGIVRYAYTGKDRTDRPALESVMDFIAGLK
jgi:antitoxin component YwqK of YwqJK toxin-antitoxin module/peroxiredoxin